MTDPLDRMRAESDRLKSELTLRAEIERLRKERDEARSEIERMRTVLDWLLPQLFRRIYPEYDLGHPHMYVLITAVKQPDGGIPKDMLETIEPFLDAKP